MSSHRTETPFSIIRGEGNPRDSVRLPKEMTPPEATSQRFKSLCAEIALPSDANEVLNPGQKDFYIGTFGYIFTAGLISPQDSQYGPTDLSPFLKDQLRRLELKLSPAFIAPFEEHAKAIPKTIQNALIFVARRVAFVAGDHLREFDITDRFVQETLLVIDGCKQVAEFNPELRPPQGSVDWAFGVYKRRVGLN